MKPILALFFLMTPALITAQSSTEIDVQAAPGITRNIFNSPEIYVPLNADTLNADNLLRNESFGFTELKAAQKWRRGFHRFGMTGSAEFKRYTTTKQANTTEFEVGMTYDHRPTKRRLRKGLELRLRSQDRLGINVLGSELLTPFSFRQIAGSGYLSKKNKAGHQLTWEALVSYKDYDECIGCGLKQEDVSLTQFEWSTELTGEIALPDLGGETQKITLSARFRDRKYRDWINYDILKPVVLPEDTTPFIAFDPNLDYVPRSWRYVIGQVMYQLPLGKGMKIKAGAEYTRRWDLNVGDFGFHQLQPAVSFYFKKDKWDLRLSGSYTLRNYTDRLAQQELGTPFPTLTYTYLRGRARIHRDLNSGFYLWTEVASANRDSNTSSINTRVRRSYVNGMAMLGFGWKWEKTRRRLG